MKKVFIIHGFEGSPNGGWRPWLMSELEKKDVYACALSMPSPEKPVCVEWVAEISRHIERNIDDQIYLVGHSLGVSAILRYLENLEKNINIAGAVLVSGPCKKNNNRKIDSFLENDFDYQVIKSRCLTFSIIHGDNDTYVPLEHAKILEEKLNGELVVVKNGGHLNGSAGFLMLPQCLEVLEKMMK